MQNAQNQMSSFEFIAALMSIIIGLGVTNLLAGAGRAFYRRKENPLDEVHLVLTVATLLLLVLQWWITSQSSFTRPTSRKRKNTRAVSNGTAQGTTPSSLRCVCSTSRKRQFTANSFSRYGTYRSSGNMRYLLAAVSSPADAVTIGSSRGTSLSHSWFGHWW